MREYIDKHFDEIVDDLRQLVKFNSEYSEDEKPFGLENRKVLDKSLSLMEEKGIKTTNLDYYCGYGEVGEGEKVIGIVSHLDIVPAGEGWDSDPFELTIKADSLFGRGTSDDKGATVAAMWAVKYLLDTGYKFKKRVRLINGCNEETGSACVRHYVEKCGDVDMGFTPDGDFPGIYAEKGMIGGYLVGHNSKIIDIKGGDGSNIVAKKCTATLPAKSFDLDKLDDFFTEKGIKYELKNNVSSVDLTVYGKAAHASTPDFGINAISYLMAGLKYCGFEDSYVDFYMKNFGLTTHGEILGYEELKDSESNTSINMGVIYKEGNDIKCTLDMRFPVKQNSETCLQPLLAIKDEDNEFILRGKGVEPLYFDISSPFIQALDKAYRTVTGDTEHQMEAIGGGTYAKAMKNIIAFGCELPGEQNNIHDANEHVEIESLKTQIMCYIEAIKNLNEVE
ncbi:MAG: Sapep family Mn(2+)-dependent dipeptidase [Erysipelotrichaceae bacterium]|nr:Sapep family Mn(2+)-dependent dipeptidase [Erysipelotrichaceae bacterium]